MNARALELYRKPGDAQAAREITAALQGAKKQLRATLKKGHMYTQTDVRVAFATARDMVYDVLMKHAALGAMDTEPRFHVRNALYETVASCLGRSAEEAADICD